MKSYSTDPAWSDIEPLPQDDGTANPLAAIAYAPEYVEAMSYLRAVMAKNELSERVLGLTSDVIGMNPAHYTIWLYRAKTLFAVDADLQAEIAWLNEIALANLKNYQIWHHRHTLVEAIASKLAAASPELDRLLQHEADFLGRMFERDAKNYHVWSHRQWMVDHFGLWDDERELRFVEHMLGQDVRNNSAWNHRWFVIFGRPDAPKSSEKAECKAILDREMDFAQDAIRTAPQNQSPWNYLKGLVARFGLPLSTIKGFAGEFASVEDDGHVKSSHALDVLSEVYQEDKKSEEAVRALDLLASKYDPIRSRYWMWRKEPLAAA